MRLEIAVCSMVPHDAILKELQEGLAFFAFADPLARHGFVSHISNELVEVLRVLVHINVSLSISEKLDHSTFFW